MQDLSLHLLDIAENSIEARARRVEIRLEENRSENRLTLEIRDDGVGMDEETRRRALDPFFTTRTTRRVGLGLPLLAQAARAANGSVTLESEPGKGTHLRAIFELDHLDRKPLGDIAQTLITLIAGHSEVEFIYTHDIDGREFRLDTRQLRVQLGAIAIHSPEVLAILKDKINEGLEQLRRENEPRKSL